MNQVFNFRAFQLCNFRTLQEAGDSFHPTSRTKIQIINAVKKIPAPIRA
jgi:hypothetical protein